MLCEECGQQVKGSDPTPLLSPGEATSGVLCPVLGSSVQEGQGAPGALKCLTKESLPFPCTACRGGKEPGA